MLLHVLLLIDLRIFNFNDLFIFINEMLKIALDVFHCTVLVHSLTSKNGTH